MAENDLEQTRPVDDTKDNEPTGVQREDYLTNSTTKELPQAKDDSSLKSMNLASADALLAGFKDTGAGLPGGKVNGAEQFAQKAPEKGEQGKNPEAKPDGPIKKDSDGNITDVTHPDGSRHHIEYKNGKPSELVSYDKDGKETGRSQSGKDLEISVKEDGTIEKKNMKTHEIKGDVTYDRQGKPVSQRTSEMTETTSTETIKPDGSSTLKDHRTGSVTETKPDGSKVETKLNGERLETTKDGKTTTFVKDKHTGNEVRITPDGKYFVKGSDGQEREFVDAGKQDQTPAGPTRYFTNGGKVENQSDRPILALGKGPGHEGNSHGDGFLRVVKPGESTDPTKTDYDGIVTDSRYQPVTLPDGKVLMPASVPPDAAYTKVSDSYTAQVNVKEGQVKVTSPNWTNGLKPNQTISDYTGNAPIFPQKPGQTKARRE